VKRRHFITLLGGATAAWPLTARAQQPNRVWRIAMLQPLAPDDPEAQLRIATFRRRLQELGWIDGQNVRIDYGWAPGDTNRMRAQAAELVRLKPDVIVGAATPVVVALQAETQTIPILFVQVFDPVAAGLVTSLAHPGGNLTGITNFESAIAGKWLELLKQVSPQVARVAILYYPKTAPYAGSYLRLLAAAAPSFALELVDTPVHDAADTQSAINAFAQQQANGGLLVFPDVSTAFHRDLIIALAAKHRLPAMYPFRYFALSGGLVAYGIDSADSYRQIASYVDQILRGRKPEELPVQAPVKFELIINVKTAKALGIEVPAMLLALADEVME
jgi:putative tryptophan/tyrosine transport system substrate-binding protein